MPTASQYQHKYIELLKLYHQLHAIQAELHQKLWNIVSKMKQSTHNWDKIQKVFGEYAKKIEDIDGKLMEIVGEK